MPTRRPDCDHWATSWGPRPGRCATTRLRDDPKRLVGINRALDDAMEAGTPGRSAEAIDTPSASRARASGSHAGLRSSGVSSCSRPVGSTKRSRCLEGAARDGHADSALLRSLVDPCFADARNLQKSAAVPRGPVGTGFGGPAMLRRARSDPHKAGPRADAETMFRRVLAASPNAAATWNNLGVRALTENRDVDAVGALSRAIAIDPALAGARQSWRCLREARGQAEGD